jgi:hypothetical protein
VPVALVGECSRSLSPPLVGEPPGTRSAAD